MYLYIGSFFGTYRYDDPLLNWNTCYVSGIVILTCTSVAFPCLTAFVIMELLRYTGIESTSKLVKIEFILYTIASLSFVAGVGTYGGCVAQINNRIPIEFGNAYSIGWPIYGCMVGAAAFMVFGIVHAALVLNYTDFQSLNDVDGITSNTHTDNNNSTELYPRARRLTMTAAVVDRKTQYNFEREIERHNRLQLQLQQQRQLIQASM